MRIEVVLLLSLSAFLAACGGGGGGSTGGGPVNNNPAPSVSSLSPTSASAGGSAFTLTVNGNSFIATSSVRWNGSARPTTFVNNTQLTAAITAADIAAGGTASVTVNNPAPGGGTSGVLNFTITSNTPTITSLNPSATLAGSAAFTLTVNGSNFDNTSTVLWNGSARATTFVSSNQLTASILAGDIAASGTFPVTVRTTGFSDSNGVNFQVTTTSSLSVTTTQLPPSGNGKNYYFQLATSGGTAPIAWAVTNGNLPAGLSLNSSTGIISGTITDVTGSTFTVQATDSAFTPNVGARSLTVTLSGLGRNDNISACGGSDIATPISNGRLRASISPYGDVDTYTFTLTQTNNSLTIQTFAEELNVGNNLAVQSDFLDTVMELLDSSCNVVALNDDLSFSPQHVTDSLIIIGPAPFPTSNTLDPNYNPFDMPAPASLPAGTYYIRIRDYRGDGRPDMIYDLSVSGIQ